jgi:hypothetical protein
MRALLTIFGFVLAFQSGTCAWAGDLPEKIKAHILKRHPQAQDFQTQPEVHFGNKLLEVTYKTGPEEDRVMELFTSGGHLFTNELKMEGYDQVSLAARETLKTQLGDYRIEKGELIGNPNGAGEEYELYLLSDNHRWRVSISDKGQISEKTPY